MKFRTKIEIPKQSPPIDYKSEILLFGSCFTENLEKHLSYYQFKNNANPHGILFNPKSIEIAIEDCITKKEYNQHDLGYTDDLWFSFNHHSSFSSVYLAKVLEHINHNIVETHKALKTASHVLITLGTSWVYRFKETENLVANCHKIPQRKFSKEILTGDEITKILNRIISLIKTVNHSANIIFTVSPIRHLKNGFVENTQSKASLHSAIHNVIDKEQSFYFPSFEIMMDDLRDYRFYKNDLLHPNEFAMEYIWEKFKGAWINSKSYPLMKKINSIQKSLEHIPFREESEKHKEFLKKLNKKIEEVSKAYPHIKF